MDVNEYTAGLEYEVIRLREMLKKERKKKKRWKRRAMNLFSQLARNAGEINEESE